MLDKLLINIIPVTVFFGLGVANSYEKTLYAEASVTIKNGEQKPFQTHAKYMEKNNMKDAQGYLFYSKDTDWCFTLPDSVRSRIPQKPWIALIPGGRNCTCRKQLEAAKNYNASAAIIYVIVGNRECEEQTQTHVRGLGLVSVSIGMVDANKIIQFYSENTHILCEIKSGKKFVEKQFKVSRTSVLFVLVSFILLMCISLAWLVFYYVQRFRHIYRNDRKEKQLLSAAKKAISKLKTISFQAANKDGEEDSCAVCLENYKEGENIRVLPCKHLFHKACIDPWLLNHRTCPMCKSNILKSLGVEIPDNIDLSQYDVESRRISREVETVQSSPAQSAPVEEALPDEHDVPSTSVFPTGSSSQAWSEPNVVSASCCSSTSSMLSDTDSERSTVALVSVVQKV